MFQEVGLGASSAEAVTLQAKFANIQNQLITGAIRGTVSATIRTAIEGGDYEDAIISALRSAAVNVASAQVHEFIGDIGQAGGLPDGHPIKVLLHGAVGGGEFVHGTVAAATAELSSNFFDFEDPNAGETAVRIVGALTTALLGGDGKDVNISADIAGSVETNNRRLHLKEAQKLAQLTAGKTAAEKNRYIAAACALVKCADGVPEADENYANLRALQLQGEDYTLEQKALRQTGYFDYGALGGLLLDKRTASAEFIKRGYGIVQLGTGAVVVVDSTALGAGSCTVTLGAGCAIGGSAAVIGIVAGGDLIRSGYVNLTKNFKSSEGAAVLQSFNTDANKHPSVYGTVYDDAFGVGIYAIEALGGRFVAKYGQKAFDTLKAARTQKLTFQAAENLGIDLNKIDILGDVASTKITLTTNISKSDIDLILSHVKNKGANKAQISSGYVANEKLFDFLEKRVADGKLFLGGKVTRNVGNQPGDFIVTYEKF